MGQKVASLEIELLMATGQAVSDLVRFGGVVDKTTAEAIKAADRIDAAMKGIGDMSAAERSAVKFADTLAKTAVASARELSRIEVAGEKLSASLDRQIATFGKSTDEIRRSQVATAALAAEQKGMTELAERLRSQEQQLWDLEYAAARKAEQEARALAEARDAEAAAAAREAQAVRDAAAAHQLFEAYARKSMQAYRDQQAAEAQAAKDDNAARLRAEAVAAGQLAEARAALAAQVRASHDAQEADAAAAERLREATDPLYASVKRLNAEIEESNRLYRAGATAPEEYARQQQVLTNRLKETTAAHSQAAEATNRNGFAMKMTAMQIPDIVQGLLTGQKPMTVFLQQGGQIAQIAQMAEGGIKGYATEIGALALRFTPLIAATSVASVALYRWHEQLNDDGGIKKFVDGLGLTHKELKKLDDQTVTTGDMIAGLWKTVSDGLSLGGDGKKLLDYLFSPGDAKQVEQFVAEIYGVFVGGYNAIVTLWGQLWGAVSTYVSAAASAVGAFFKPVVDAAEWAGAGVEKIFSAIYDMAAGWARPLGEWIAPVLKAIGLESAADSVQSAGSKIGATFGNAYSAAVKQAVGGMDKFFTDAGNNAVQHAQQRLQKQADSIIADRTPKTDKHAEQLEREAEAIEAQIKNLYKLADAYGVSDAAALIAEARTKAESKAIKDQGDVEEAVNRQIRLTIAQRVADGEKSAAASRLQAKAQSDVNDLVAAGLIPASRAAELVRNRIADAPLEAAAEAALSRGLTEAAARATKALLDQRDAREAANKAQRDAQYLSAMSSAKDELDRLQLEAELVGATDAARVHALATLKAWQEAEANGWPVDQALAYVAAQVKMADQAQANTTAQDAYNQSLSFAADMFDALDESAQTAARGIANAFGDIGSAIGDSLTTLTGFYAKDARLREEHAEQLKKYLGNQAATDRENALYAVKTSQQQIGLYGDMTEAAEGFFKKGSTGYKALHAAEQVFRVAQMAMSVAAIFQDSAETISHVANSGARASASAAEGVAAQAKLPFPANLAAMAATAAALVAIGVTIAGAISGGSKNTLPAANDGTGTVLGDASAKSASISNSIDALKDVDTVMLTYSRQMAESLKSIDGKIGGLSTLIARENATTGVNASAGVTTGFNTDAIGSLLSNVPLIGGFLSSLFGSKTTVVGSGIYGAGQSLGSVVSDGYDADYYSDIEKKKKFLGITTSTKYSTQYSDASDELESQFTSILKSFYTAIDAAAGPLGLATGDVEDRLNSFVVSIGKIDLQGLSGDEISDKLSAVFGAAADNIAEAAVPGLEKFQQVGEGYFETLVRVSSTVEQVNATFEKLGTNSSALGIDVDMAVAGMFDSVSDFTSAADDYFSRYYSSAEQAAAKTAQMGKVFDSLGMQMPDTLDGFRKLVEAQDLTTEAGQSNYATLLKLAPAFADLQESMDGATSAAKSAADILSERQDLERQLLEAQGDTDAIRALDLAKLDESNRALQEHIWALADEKAAADAAAQAAADLAQKQAAIASEREGLEKQLLTLQGDTAELRRRELDALDPSNRALQQAIYDFTDMKAATDAAAQAAQEAAQAEAALATQREQLETQILTLQGNTTELRRRELDALDESLRPLQQMVYDLTDAKDAADEAAQAQAELASAQEQAAQNAAQQAQSVTDERAGLIQQLVEEMGDTAALRELELAKINPVNQGIQQLIWSMEDQKAATDAAAQAAQDAADKEASIASERAGLMNQLWQLTGDTASIRAAELAALDPSNRALQQRIYDLTDEQAAAEAAAQAAQDQAQAAEQAAQAAEQLRQAWVSIGDSLMDEVKRIRGLTDTAPQSYAALLGQFNDATSLARAGDQDAAKSLPDLSKELLDAAEQMATSRQELARIQAMAAASLEDTYGVIAAGAFSANDNSSSSTAWFPSTVSPSADASTGSSSDLIAELRELRAEVAGFREDQRSANGTMAGYQKKTADVLVAVSGGTGGDAFKVEVEAA